MLFSYSSFALLRNMKLTLLDTSNLILLSGIKKTNPQRFEEFPNEWKKDSVLAVFQTHLIGLLKAKYHNTKTAHLDLLHSFLPFRYESQKIFEKEVILALFKKGMYKIKNGTDSNIRFFSNVVRNREELLLAFNTISLISNFGIFNLIASGQKSSWKAKASDTFYKAPKPKFSDMGKNFGGKFIKKIYAKLIGIDWNNPKNNNKSIETLLDEFLFRVQIKSTLRNHFGISDIAFSKRIAEKITVKDCQGLWLRREVEKNLIKAGSSDYKNDYDLDNIQYLPYVDCLISDKRIVDATEQVLRQNNLLDSLKSISPPKKVSNSIESLEKALFR